MVMLPDEAVGKSPEVTVKKTLHPDPGTAAPKPE